MRFMQVRSARRNRVVSLRSHSQLSLASKHKFSLSHNEEHVGTTAERDSALFNCWENRDDGVSNVAGRIFVNVQTIESHNARTWISRPKFPMIPRSTLARRRADRNPHLRRPRGLVLVFACLSPSFKMSSNFDHLPSSQNISISGSARISLTSL